METYAYGFPRLSKQREFKKIAESFWQGKVSEEELIEGLWKIEDNMELIYSKYVKGFPSCEITAYDHMLDAAIFYGLYKAYTLGKYFELCRGKKALEITKWFNTNYHYLVPDFSNPSMAKLSLNGSILERVKPIKKNTENLFIVGPFTFLKLSKNLPDQYFEGTLIDAVEILIEFIESKDVNSVHLDDPALVSDLNEKDKSSLKKAYSLFEKTQAKINIFTYYDYLDNLEFILDLPINGLGVDTVHDKGVNLEKLKRLKTDKTIFLGVVDGRNVWKTDIKKQLKIIDTLGENIDDLVITNAAPLYHLPVSLDGSDLSKGLINKLAFAQERLYELGLIASGDIEKINDWLKDIDLNKYNKTNIKKKIENLKGDDFKREKDYKERTKIQKELLNLPLFPTTTIGSFPQTEEVRRLRLLYKNGKIDEDSYKTFIKGESAKAIKIQEDIGLDVLVHGEFERSDMVEFFAEKLEGIATTKNGWIISYGTRCYRPPIIYGDIERTKPLTLDDITFAQSTTNRPVKGMLTGPITILSWSYPRQDIEEKAVAYQLATAIRDEINDYQERGIKIIQIDEPAFKEKAPIKKKEWTEYFNWAIKAFNLSISSAKPQTQIHTHMCYSEFRDIVNFIKQLDFDVISIETSRSKGDIIEAFEKVGFDRQIGLGVWDIHSPVIPEVSDMEDIVRRALRVIPKENFWLNPDCGLKTRRWEEVIPSLKNMMKLKDKLRNLYGD